MEWKNVLEANVCESMYMNSADRRRFLGAEYGKLKDILVKLGFAK